ncbi:SusC/RagA family TonB-linked outer membrane protein [Bacteroidia bacterium]|nr:SusC/RagA family TonB-linked outer membrane protein [Bacteroidia bacterium]
MLAIRMMIAVFFMGVGTMIANAQTFTVKGTVRDNTGEALIGTSVAVKGGGSGGAITDINGRYSIDVPNGNAILVFSFLGYITQEKAVNNQSAVDVTMAENSQILDEVVVTALGIVKKEKSLTYSTQIVDAKELTRAKDPNLINALVGKTAGVKINRSASGLGGSVKVIIRGERSASGGNQPLYVIDGVPISGGSNSSVATTIGGNNDSANRDSGDGISNLNPDDIESMNILKGPAAAALYGSSAANGVIVITTKKGKAGRTDIAFSSNTTWETAAYGIPEFQNSYTGVTSSWGGKINGSPDYTKDFFNTGMTTINSLTLSKGTDQQQTYFSYANTYGKGILGVNKLSKHNLNFRETSNFFDNKLTVDANINLIYQKGKNRATPGGYYMNPLVGLYRFPRGGVEGGESFDYYKKNYTRFDIERNMTLQNWYKKPDSFEENPYWLINKIPNEDERFRAIANLNLSLKLNENFTLSARGKADVTADNYELKAYAGIDESIATGSNGRYIVSESNDMNLYGDVLLTYLQQLGKLSVNATLGSSINDSRGRSMGMDSFGGGLYNPNIFSIGNINLNSSRPSLGKSHSQSQAVFFAGQLGFSDWLFLDVTARNDWTSSLAYTDYVDKGFFYPSIGLTYLLNESLKLPQWVNLGKVRGAWSKVGNGLPNYRSNPLNTVGNNGVINYNTTTPFSELKPEMTTSIEMGTEWRLFANRLEFDFTYYKTNTRNQLFSLSAPSGSKYTTYYVNAGNIQNKGMEVVLSGSPILKNDFRWKTGLNYSQNDNKIIELAEGLDIIRMGSGSNNYEMRLTPGGSFGDLFGRAFLRDEQGVIQYDSRDIPRADGSDYKKLGNATPDFNLGWQNTITYKDFSLYFLIDGSFGGEAISLTQADLDQYGVTKATGDARNRGHVTLEGKEINDVERFYTTIGGRSGITEYYVNDATNIRLRELSIGYTLPGKLLGNSHIKNIDLSLIGRNLFFLLNKAPYDPDGTLSVGNSLQGVDVFGLPSTRSIGFNIKVNF